MILMCGFRLQTTVTWLCFALGGCATGPTWNKPGATQASFAADKYAYLKETPNNAISLLLIWAFRP
jgi:hypothetical protein